MKHKILVFLITYLVNQSLNSQALFKDFASGKENGYVSLVGVTDSFALLSARNDTGQYGLWRTDGTINGTKFLKPYHLFQMNSPFYENSYFDGKRFWFSHFNDFNNNKGTFTAIASDGTDTGTHEIGVYSYQIVNYLDDPRIFIFKGNTCFINRDSTGVNIFSSDGTKAGTKSIINLDSLGLNFIYLHNIQVVGDQFYFYYFGAQTGHEPWVSDGTQNGTHLISDLLPGTGSSIRSKLVSSPLKDKGYFFAGTTLSIRTTNLYETDGTEGGTQAIMSFYSDSSQALSISLISHGDSIYLISAPFNQTHRQLIAIDDIRDTHYLPVKNPFFDILRFYRMHYHAGTFYILAQCSNIGLEWLTLKYPYNQLELLLDISPGVNSSYYQDMIWIKNRLYMIATNSGFDMDIWTSDGSTANTRIFYQIPGNNDHQAIFTLKDKLFACSSLDTNYGHELYVFDNLTGIKQVSRFSNAHIYPNPIHAGETMHIRHNEAIQNIRLFDLNGREIECSNDGSAVQIPDKIEAGIYLLTYQIGLEYFHHRLVIN